MLSKKADLKNISEIGVLGATILCAKRGCEGDGPEIYIGRLKIRLYLGGPAKEAQAPQRKRGQASLLELVGRPQRSQPQRPQRPPESPKEERPKAQAAAQAEERRSEAAEKKGEERGGAGGERREPAPGGADKPEHVDVESLVRIASGAIGVGPAETKRAVEAALSYLSTYPSVGILRFLEDVKKIAKVDPEVLRRLLNIMRALDIVELHEVGVVNLKKKIEVRRETKL